MDPLTLAATAIAATIMTKFWEKTGEKLGEKVFSESEKFLRALKTKAPETGIAIEKASEQPLDYGQAVLEVQALAVRDSEIAEAIQSLVLVAEEEPNVRLRNIAQEIINALRNQQPTVQNAGKLAEKIGVIVQGGSVNLIGNKSPNP
jgi:phosphoenolpyruvate-protein kinase (PTS system EI component)